MQTVLYSHLAKALTLNTEIGISHCHIFGEEICQIQLLDVSEISSKLLHAYNCLGLAHRSSLNSSGATRPYHCKDLCEMVKTITELLNGTRHGHTHSFFRHCRWCRGYSFAFPWCTWCTQQVCPRWCGRFLNIEWDDENKTPILLLTWEAIKSVTSSTSCVADCVATSTSSSSDWLRKASAGISSSEWGAMLGWEEAATLLLLLRFWPPGRWTCLPLGVEGRSSCRAL